MCHGRYPSGVRLNAACCAAVKLREDLINIARTTLSSKILTQSKEQFSKMAVDAVMCLKGRTNLEAIHIIKKAGATLKESYLAEVRRHLASPVWPR